MECFLPWLMILVGPDLFHMTFPYKVCAYLDPGTGSFLIQLLIGALFGGLLAVKLFWHNVKNFFKKPSAKEKKLEKHED